MEVVWAWAAKAIPPSTEVINNVSLVSFIMIFLFLIGMAADVLVGIPGYQVIRLSIFSPRLLI